MKEFRLMGERTQHGFLCSISYLNNEVLHQRQPILSIQGEQNP